MNARDASLRRPAVFVDKDGTLVRDVPYNVDPARVEFTDGALRGLARLSAAGYAIVVVSNQPGIGLGHFTQGALDALARHLSERLAGAGIALTGFYACPHRPPDARGLSSACTCRKPAPGLLQRAAHDHALSLDDSWMIGDILDDVEAGQRAGCRTVFLDVGHETKWRLGPLRTPTVVARNLADAARAVLRHGQVMRHWRATAAAPA